MYMCFGEYYILDINNYFHLYKFSVVILFVN